MNNSSVTVEELVQEVNDELAQLFIPSIVTICVLMVTGLVGNSMVCYYYGFKAKRTPTSVFILTLAAYDLIACSVTMPHEIVLSLNFYTYNSKLSCKIVHLIGYFLVVASAFTLPVIALDRYRNICASSAYQTTVKDAIKQCAIVAILALLFSWPVVILYGIEVEPLPMEYGQGLEGFSCVRREDLSDYSFVLDVVYLVMIFLIATLLSALYIRIIRALYIHQQRLRNSQTTQPPVENSRVIDRKTAKITIAMIVITIVFFLSFIPRVFVLMWYTIEGTRESQVLSGAKLLWSKMGKQSYMLNSSLNPWIYGIFNSQFRKFYFRKLCKVCNHCRHANATS